MSITFFDPSTGDRVMLPSKNEVCTRCFGSGTHDSWDNGMTADEMYEWGDDFVDDYFAGHYDTVCEECNGNNVVAVIDEQRCTPEQIEAGVVEPSPEVKARIQELLTFDEPPDPAEIIRRAEEFAALAYYEIVTAEYDSETVMIGGAPFFISALERELMFRGMDPVYAFSMRESIDQAQEDGSVRKVAVFRHLGFVRPPRHEDFEAYVINKFSREEGL